MVKRKSENAMRGSLEKTTTPSIILPDSPLKKFTKILNRT